jgi:iron(III) transport system substrate-binding protein
MKRLLIGVGVLQFVAFGIISYSASNPAGDQEVVVYTSLDQIYSEPILKQFEKETGITVRVRYDTEASKTTGLFNRLIAEKPRPRCDVFWNNEVLRTVQLKSMGLLQPYAASNAAGIPARFKDSENYWTGFAARGRVIVYNSKLLTSFTAPASIYDLSKPQWRKRIGIAYPLFGTTASHGAALFALLGPEKAQAYFRALQANGVQVLDGNATVCRSVGNGELAAGLTDTDDVYAMQLDGRPVASILPDQGPDGIGMLVIPNTVALINNCPNPEPGKRLINYLLDPKVENALAVGRSAQIPVRPGDVKSKTGIDLEKVRVMPCDYEKTAAMMEPSARFFQELFVR